MSTIDKGGGQRGGGGTLADGSVDDAVAKPVLEGRAPLDYTPPINPGVRPEIDAVEVDEAVSATTQYRLTAVNEDTLTVEEFDGNAGGATVQIARPYNQRRGVWDGREVTVLINGELVTGTYEYETNVRRIFTFQNNNRQIIEEVFPPYLAGDTLYGVTVANGTSVEGVNILENNNDGRYFRPVLQTLRQFIIESEEFDYWVCRTIINGAIDASATVNVAKPYNLRKTPFDKTDIGGAFNGIEYTYSTDTDDRVIRSAEDVTESITQEEHLIPRVYFNQSRIYAALVEESGVSVDGNDLKLLDINVDARYWTRRG